MALQLVGRGMRQAAGYQNKDATFAGVLVFLRRATWASRYLVNF